MIKKISNFTQTYQGTTKWSPGSDCKDRNFLIEAFCKNKNKIKAYELLDLQTFNFHNMDLDNAKKLASQLKSVLPNIKCTCYNDTSLGYCIYEHMQFLKMQGMTDFLWIQDDEFFTYKNFEDFKKVYEFYKQTPEIKNLNLLYSISDTPGLVPQNTINIPNCEITLHQFTALDIKPFRSYAMDFTAFICNIDYFLEYMYEKRFEQILDAYQLEGAVLHKSLSNNIQRCFLNTNFFESFNIVGMGGSLGNSKERSQKLKELFDVAVNDQ